MATAYGPEPVHGNPLVHIMGDSSVDSLNDISNSMAPEHFSRVAPTPNPVFSFPAQTGDTSSPSTDNVPRRARRRPMSAIEPVTESYQLTADAPNIDTMGRTALPAFSFNPGASLPPNHGSSLAEILPSSPQLPRTLPSGPRVGHRRGGSEFVGGRLREGSSIAVMTGAPTKQDLLGLPSLTPPRRGHRRGVSSTLSTNDLSFLAPPNPEFALKGCSAPSSPTKFETTQPLSMMVPEITKPEPETVHVEETKEEMLDPTPAEPATQPTTSEMKPDSKPTSKARVGFSDTLEFIPRPLSLVSTDTSSTVTARPSHNVSGSISSLISIPSLDERETTSPTLSRSPSRNTNDSRPSTAGAILDRYSSTDLNMSPRRRNSIPALLDLSEANAPTASTPSPSKSSKRWSFFGLDSFSNHSSSPTKARPHSASSSESTTRAVSGCSSSDQESESQTESSEAKKSSKNSCERRDKKKRRKKVKGWAGSILPRKSKLNDGKRSKYAVRPPTPPSSVVPPDDEDDDDITSSAVYSPLMTTEKTPPSPPLAPTPLAPTPQFQFEEVSSPMIDLDAALGPFNTPLPDNPEWDAAQRAAGSAGKRRLHSAQGMRGFSGPGMHYHRRTESAPDLPPFDAARAGLSRFGSSSTMADVFEEEEEDTEAANGQQSQAGTSIHSCDDVGDMTPLAFPQSEPIQEPIINMRRKSSGLSDKEQSSSNSIRARRSRASLHDSPIAEEHIGVRFNTINAFQTDASRNKTPTKDLSTFEFGAPQVPYVSTSQISPHSMSFPSSVPRSPMSVDNQRLSTAPSSVQEDNSFHSLLLGKPGPEVRRSIDYDVPSLSSCTSTTTRESGFVPQMRMSQPAIREPRPLSVSSTAFGRRRSSLVSLSRLISTSHGERSKLSMEVTLDNENDKKKSKHGRAKRLGRLMQFWKPHKSSETPTNQRPS